MSTSVQHGIWQRLLLGALIAVCVALLPVSGPLQAQTPDQPDDNNQLYYNRPGAGTISDTTPEVVWSFIANGKDRVAIAVERTGGTLVPRFDVRSERPDGPLVASAEKDLSFARAALGDVRLKANGEYFVIVSRYKGIDGKTTGDYKIMVNLLGGGNDNETFKIVQGELKLNTPRTGSLNNSRWQDQWAIMLDAPATIAVTAKRTAGTLVPALRVSDLKGNELATASADDPFAAAAIPTLQLSEPGQYLVTIGRDGGRDGATTGAYELVVSTFK
jgi:hypothetical protein